MAGRILTKKCEKAHIIPINPYTKIYNFILLYIIFTVHFAEFIKFYPTNAITIIVLQFNISTIY
jgi:hypothetical protein